MFSLVANRHGRRVIRWGYVLLTVLLITALASPIAAGLYWALTRAWNPLLFAVGPVVGVVATLFTLLVALRTPLQRLPMVR